MVSTEAQNRQPDSLAKGSLWRSIWTMSWPLLLTTTGASLVGLADMKVAGYLGSSSQAAVGVSESVLFLFMVFFMSVGTGTSALVARACGAEKMDDANQVTGQSLILAAAMGVLLMLAATVLAAPLLGLFKTAEAVRSEASRYLAFYSFFLLPFAVTTVIAASFRAIGDARTPLAIVTITTSVAIFGDYSLVYYNWPIRGLGVQGIALAGVAANFLGSLFAIYRLSKSPIRKSVSYLWPFSLSSANRVLRIGLPTAFQRLGWLLSTFMVFFILNMCKDPVAGIAAWTIGMRVEGIVFMPLMALSLAVGSIVGQSLGAKEVERAVKAGWLVSFVGVAMMVVMAGTLFFCAHAIAISMSHEEGTINYVTDYLRTNSLSEPFLAFGMILSGALQGAGDTRSPMWVSLFSNWVIRLPLAYAIAVYMKVGPMGVWISMAVSVVLMGLLMIRRFHGRAWVRTAV